MSAITNVQQKVQEFASENAPTLLTAGGVVGAVGTAVLAGRAGFKAAQIIAEMETDTIVVDETETIEVEPSTWDKVKAVGPQFIPPVALGVLTVTSIVMANRVSAQKAAALAAAYGLSRQQFEEYRAKVAEKLTGPKQEQVSSELAQERANRTPGSSQVVIIAGENDMRCFDEPTGRYFKCNMEKINRAVNKTNEEIINGEYATANYFYDQLGLTPTTWGEQVGWNRDNLVDLDVSTIFDPEDDSTPMISINFKTMPDSYFLRRMYE